MIKNKKTALLIMDIQEITVKMFKDSKKLIDSINEAIKKAKSNNIPVIYVISRFRKGYPEISDRNKAFSFLKSSKLYGFDSEENTKVYSGISLEADDVIITKKRVSAFTGSDLELVLRSFEINTLVLTGISTSGVVLSTICDASDKDYELTVLADCCTDRDEEVHRVLTNKVFPRQTEVINVEDWIIDNN